MSNVIPFRRVTQPPQGVDPNNYPTMTIHIYDSGSDNGFSYVVTGSGDPPTKERLQSYLGDMFLTLAGGPERHPGIWTGLRAFLRHIFTGD